MTGSQPLVLIDREYYHEGDMLDDEWKIQRIDVEERTVKIIHQPSGTETVLSIEQ